MATNDLISDGVHYLSGIGSTSFHNEWNDEEIEVNLFKIDDVVYGAYVDPDDGYRSYGCITATPEFVGMKCDTEFPPQKVIVENVKKEIPSCVENDWVGIDKELLIIKDAILNKNVLVVGTDYSEDYYPMAIFDYQPMNLYVNVERHINGNVD